MTVEAKLYMEKKQFRHYVVLEKLDSYNIRNENRIHHTQKQNQNG